MATTFQELESEHLVVTRFWRARKAVFHMVFDRGYQVGNKFLAETTEQVALLCRAVSAEDREGSAVQDRFLVPCHKRDDPAERIVIFFVPGKNRTQRTKSCRVCVDCMEKNSITKCVIVGQEVLERSARTEMKKLFGNMHCEIFDENELIASSSKLKEAQEEHLQTLASSLWEQHTFSDCEVASDEGHRWPAHRCVLAVGSPVLKRLLDSGMQETQGALPLITLKDARSADIEAFLHFLYKGRMPARGAPSAPQWSADGILELADMYHVTGLVHLAVKELEDELAPDTILQVVRVMKKRKTDAVIGAAYKRICQKVRKDDQLSEALMDAL
eukprot:gnl/TRDRNA2_/TRDRNA2_127886_c0_seq1.p1 gnl/TRDRNA2_/TRDRNA2_127886_c0~~gnl/TRDRNA2_/TRDRNA2_127886_c0_seq1.p1  ORF type:complete len:330 (+),score=57.84 gnl/TRDRNA2_/TRDRNA2_127886_c0_seq1:71-1060(+)